MGRWWHYLRRRRGHRLTVPRSEILVGQDIISGKEVPMEQLKFNFPIPDGYVVKFVAYITIKGKRLYAKTYGKRAWPILVKA